MAVDRNSRTRIADAIEKYLDGEIDNFALDDIHFEFIGPTTIDLACREIATELWYFYSDCSRHFNSHKHRIGAEGEQMIRRWVMFLRSSQEWQWATRFERKSSWFVIRVLIGLKEVFKGTPPACSRNVFWPWANENGWSQWLDSVDIGELENDSLC